jgi:hypothetical protein
MIKTNKICMKYKFFNFNFYKFNVYIILSVLFEIKDRHIVIEVGEEVLLELLSFFLDSGEHLILVQGSKVWEIVLELLGNRLSKQPLRMLMQYVNLVICALSRNCLNFVLRLYLFWDRIFFWLFARFARLA